MDSVTCRYIASLALLTMIETKKHTYLIYGTVRYGTEHVHKLATLTAMLQRNQCN